ncbi:MAG: TetR/AcrR family transcriptional regulator [Bacteroidales bacterium]|nr:TetR/AcrR family transcriptional regulator [Bacteroidales bacterium]
MDAHKLKILNAASALIFQRGYSRVTMDEIARSVGMSKKTIYVYFDGKYTILLEIVKKLQSDLKSDIESALMNQSLSFTEKLQHTFASVSLHFGIVDRCFTDDIQKHTPHVWNDWNDFRKEIAHIHFHQLLEEGVKAGYVKKEINISMAVFLYMSALNSLLDNHFWRQLPSSIHEKIPSGMIDLFHSIMAIIFDGILTPETRHNFNSI